MAQGFTPPLPRVGPVLLRSKRSALGQNIVSESVVTQVHDEHYSPTLGEIERSTGRRTKIGRIYHASIWLLAGQPGWPASLFQRRRVRAESVPSLGG